MKHRNNVKEFYNEMLKYNTNLRNNTSSLGSDPGSFKNSNTHSASGSEPINISNISFSKSVRFSNNTMKQNKNTRGLVNKISPSTFPYMYTNPTNPNNRYARNFTRSRESISVEPRLFPIEKVKLSPKLARIYAHLVFLTLHSRVPTLEYIQYLLNVYSQSKKITRKQATLLWKKAKFNFAK